MKEIFKELSELKCFGFIFDFKPYFSTMETCNVICSQKISNDDGGKVIRGHLFLTYDIRRKTVEECLEEIKKLASKHRDLIMNSESKT